MFAVGLCEGELVVSLDGSDGLALGANKANVVGAIVKGSILREMVGCGVGMTVGGLVGITAQPQFIVKSVIVGQVMASMNPLSPLC